MRFRSPQRVKAFRERSSIHFWGRLSVRAFEGAPCYHSIDASREVVLASRHAIACDLLCVLFAGSAAAQTPDPGRVVYASRCAGCHGSNGDGGELGPSIATRVPARTDEELTTLFRKDCPRRACLHFRASPTRKLRRSDSLPAHASAARGLRTGPHHGHAHHRRVRSRASSSIRAPTTSSCWATTGRSICFARAAIAIGR